MSQLGLKFSESSYYSQIINHHQQFRLPDFFWGNTISDDLIALSGQDGITFLDTRTGNKIGSRIPNPHHCRYLIALSPDGKWIAIQGDNRPTLEIWDVKTCTCVKTIETKSQYAYQHITYSADGAKIMTVTTFLQGTNLSIFFMSKLTNL